MANTIEYKCPSCGGKIEWNSTAQKMKCPFCDSEFDIETLQHLDDVLSAEQDSQMNWEDTGGSEWSQGETEGMRVYRCESCGGEVVTDETTAASSCPYCGNPVIMTGNFSGDLKPDCVIPFKLDKEAAKKALLAHMDGKKLLPSVFKSANKIDEIKGVYVPVWLYDADVDARIRYHGKKVRRWQDDRYEYTETNHYTILRAGDLSFERVPVDGSTKMDDTMMESLEPFDFNEAVDFRTAYLSGYLADKYDVDAEACSERANTRIKHSTLNEFAKTVQGYDSVTVEHDSINLSHGKAKYALYPVWLLNTSWNGQKFSFGMNGQSGKFVGNLPADKGKAVKFFFAAFGIAGVLVYLIGSMFSAVGFSALNTKLLLIALIVALIIGGITLGMLLGELKSVVQQYAAAEYIKKDSFLLREHEDVFTHRDLEKRELPRQTPPDQQN